MNCVSYQSGFCQNDLSGICVPNVEDCKRCNYRVSVPERESCDDKRDEPVGTILREKILKIAPVRERKTCGCEQLAEDMNTWGISGCELRREHIVTRMISNRKMLERGLQEGGRWWQAYFVTLAPDAILQAGAQWLLDQAISEAKLRYRSQQSVWNLGPITATTVDCDRFSNRCVAITSLSPNPARAERQTRCLQSWRDIGLQVLAVNTAKEHESFTDALKAIVTPIVSDDLTTIFSRQTQRITALIDTGIATDISFLLINADIEMQGNHAAIEDALRVPDKLTIGVRYNYDAAASKRMAYREPDGLDAFLLTPEMASTIPRDSPCGIGKPFWDYWLPHHLRIEGYEFNWMSEPFLFHQNHKLQWSRSEWNRCGKWFANRYGLVLKYGMRDFRESLESIVTASPIR